MIVPKARKAAHTDAPADWETIALREIAAHAKTLKLLEDAVRMLEVAVPALARERHLRAIATTLHAGLRARNKSLRDNAKRPRPATAKLREFEPEFLRADFLAWARDRHTSRGFMKAKALALNTTATTLRKRMYASLSEGEQRRFRAEVAAAAESGVLARGSKRNR